MKLRKLTLKDKEPYLNYIEEWKNEPLTPHSAGFHTNTFEEYLVQLKEHEAGSEERVPAETYFLFDEEEKIVGAINCRYGLNDFLREVGGHIGYGVSPHYRRQGLAKQMLQEALNIYREKGFKKVLLTADDKNTDSIRTIESCGGVKTESDMKNGSIPYGRYWINL